MRHLQADVGAVQGRRSVHVSELVEVSAYQRDHLPAGGGKEKEEAAQWLRGAAVSDLRRET